MFPIIREISLSRALSSSKTPSINPIVNAASADTGVPPERKSLLARPLGTRRRM